MKKETFQATLALLNKKLANASTREEHSKIDSEINNLVDAYINKKESTPSELSIANAIALAMAG